jgi:KipI family sensor histidine kinase inhibitor
MNKVLPVGDRAFLFQFGDNAKVHVFAAAARQGLGHKLSDVVPGHETVLLVWHGKRPAEEALMSDLKALASPATVFRSDTEHSAGTGPVTIPVRYDGGDLGAVAEQLGRTAQEVVELHAGAELTVAFMGFAPGFPYLIADRASDVAQLLALPRLATPRTEVQAGSVAVAAGYCGIYPRSSPGGWNLIGHTDVVLFDVARESPALLEPGTRVRFEAA